MTTRLERAIEVSATPEEVWAFIADPEQRARNISVVEEYSLGSDGHATWELALPIPVLDSTLTVETEDTEVRPPEYVEFTGRSRAMRVVGEHELSPIDGGTRLTNRFTVEGRLPGIERFFRKNLETEFDNLETGLLEFLNTD